MSSRCRVKRYDTSQDHYVDGWISPEEWAAEMQRHALGDAWGYVARKMALARNEDVDVLLWYVEALAALTRIGKSQ